MSIVTSGAVEFLRSSLALLDSAIAKAYLGARRERPALLAFLFHGLFKDEAEVRTRQVDPQQGITLAHFREFLAYFANLGYAFVSPGRILEGLPPGGRYILITFDDGYYSSFRALPLLREFRAPAAFFVSTAHVRARRCFWWDVYYREQARRGLSDKDMTGERRRLKRLPAVDIERRVAGRFGERAFLPLGDLDRPVTPEELAGFAAEEEIVHVGNHTIDHAILPNHDGAEIRRQIAGAQRELAEMTGRAPLMIAYPNGSATPEVVRIAREEGLKLGITVAPGKNRAPLPCGGDQAMLLRRFRLTATGAVGLRGQLDSCRSDISVFRVLRNAARGFK